jgi:hypothetical protein
MKDETPPEKLAGEEGYTNSLFELDYEKNPSIDPEIKKIQYAFYIWKTDSKDTDSQIDGFKSDIKDGWTDVYQLIGFFSVFQGVLFQGLTQLTSQLSCEFYKIPFTLSVLASVATVTGAHVKLSKVRGYRKAFFRAKLRSKVRSIHTLHFSRI